MSTLFVTDLDGTLLGADARISQESAALLRPMLDEGLQLAVATARSPATVVELLRPLGLRTPAVLMTGTMIYDVAHTRCLAATPLARETAAAVCAVLERTGQEALAYSVKGGHLYVYYKEFACDFERSFVSSRIHSPYKTFVQVEHYPEALAGGDTLMFLLALPGAEEARAFYDIFSAIPGLICYYYSDEYGSGGCLLEIYPEGCTKASALARVMEMSSALGTTSMTYRCSASPRRAAPWPTPCPKRAPPLHASSAPTRKTAWPAGWPSTGETGNDTSRYRAAAAAVV